MMKGLILSGGKGTRLYPLTYTRAKQLIPVANKPVLVRVIEAIRAAGVCDIGMVVGHTGPEIQDALGDGSRWGVSLSYIQQERPDGLAHAVKIARDFLEDEPFVMFLGDNVIEGGISQLIRDFADNDWNSQIVLKEVENPSAYGVAKLRADGSIEALIEKPKMPPSNLALVGIYMFDHHVFQAVDAIRPSARGEYEITDAIQWLINQGHTVYPHIHRGWWIDTGKPTDMLDANSHVLEEILPSVAASAEIDTRSTVDSRVTIQAGAKIVRKMLVEDYLVAVISIPGGVFNPYSGVKTSILILDRALARRTDAIAFFKVENDGFDLGAQRRPVEKNDLPRVQAELGEYLGHLRTGEPLDTYETKMGLVATKAKIATDGDYNLNGERYRESKLHEHQKWPMMKLGDVCHVINGSTPSRKNSEYWEGGTVPWFTIDDVRANGRIVRETIQSTTDKALEETSIKLLPCQTVLLCCTASVGEYAFSEIELTTNQQFNGLVIKDEFSQRLLPKYLFCLSSQFKEELLRLSGKTSFDFVAGRTLKTIQIPVPPLDVQREIVAEIEGYQKVIDGARAVVENYRPRVAVDPEWPVEPIKNVASVESGFGFPLVHQGRTTEQVPFLKVSDMNLSGNETRILTWNNSVSFETLTELKAKAFPAGTVIFPKIGAAIATNKKRVLNRESTYDNNVMGIVPNTGKLLPGFLYGWLMGFDLSRWASDGQPPSMRKTVVEQHSIPVPPLDTQSEIIAELEAEQSIVGANRELIERFENKIQATVARVNGSPRDTGT